MPAVDRPPLQEHSSPSLGLELKPHERLLGNLAGASLVLVLLLAIRLIAARRSRNNRIRDEAYKRAVSSAIQQQRLWFSAEKSRGVSSNGAPMSANHGPDSPQLRGDAVPGMDGLVHDGWDGVEGHDVIGAEGTLAAGLRLETGVATWSMKARPPPPPPLTPPVLSSKGAFSFEDRRLSVAVSAVGELDNNFFDQPNPDYTSSTPDSSSSALEQKQPSPSTPRRRSYTKMISLGSFQPSYGSPDDRPITTFAPSSFPSSSPILPLAPHASFEPREIDMQGEIISVTDDAGAGWKRHTRVYGGGVCLACMAAEGQHGGGFYGENVRPEERR